MVIVRTVEEFYKYNEKELRLFMIYKTGIRDKNIIDDTIQEFYLRLIKSKALEKFDPTRSDVIDKKSLFQMWICNYFCWLLPLMKIKNQRVRFKMVSNVVVRRNGMEEEVNVFELLGNKESDYIISENYYYDNLKAYEESELKLNLASFFKYIRDTEKSKKSSQIIAYANYRIIGLNGTDIATLMGVSSPMVNAIKKQTIQKLSKWLKTQNLCPAH